MIALKTLLREERLDSVPAPEDGPEDDAILLHNTVYDELCWRMITGRITPGVTLSTRGLAQELGVSQMPVREALARLAAERAIEIRSKRRITVPPMTPARFDDLLRCRLLLEPEAARLSLDFIDRQRLNQLIETLWLQFGPYMRVVYGRFGTAQLVDQHQVALAAIEARNPDALARAIHRDIEDGMGLIGRSGLV